MAKSKSVAPEYFDLASGSSQEKLVRSTDGFLDVRDVLKAAFGTDGAVKRLSSACGSSFGIKNARRVHWKGGRGTGRVIADVNDILDLLSRARFEVRRSPPNWRAVSAQIEIYACSGFPPPLMMK